MAGIKFSNFSGIRPKSTNLRLGIGEALATENVDLRRGILTPLVRQLAFTAGTDPEVVAADTVEVLYKFRDKETLTDYWIAKSADVDFAPGPIITEEQRQYYTGDGAPKMFTDVSVADTTPSHGGAADDTYPYGWFYLGIPAPAAAPVLDLTGVTTPREVTAGTITKVIAPGISFGHTNNTVPGSGNDATWWEAQVDGPNSTFYRVPSGDPRQRIGTNSLNQANTGFTTGLRMKVASVIDADNFTVVGTNGAANVTRLDVADMGWHVDDGTDPFFGDGRHRLTYDTNRLWAWRWDIFLPNNVEVECVGHGLQVDDVVRITGVVESFYWSSDTTMNVTPSSGESRWATKADTTDIEFTGEMTFITERDGADVDTTLDATELPDTTSRAYVYTYVSEIGEESAPSDATDVITLYEGDTIGLGTFSAPPTDHTKITHIRIYRTATGTSETDFQLVTEIPIATTTYSDALADDELGEVLQSELWDVPPTNMKGIREMPNGMMVGFYDNVLCFSEPGYPHAWPVDYRYAVGPQIVGIGVVGTSVIVATEGAPSVATGTHSRQIALRNVEEPSPCVDKRSVVDAGGTVFYCSTAGLIAANESVFKNTTEEFYTKEQWQEIVGPPGVASRVVRGWYHDNCYILDATWGSPGGSPVSNKLIFDFSDPDGLKITNFTDTIDAAFYDKSNGDLYYLVPSADIPAGAEAVGDGARPVLRWGYQHPSTDLENAYTQGSWQSGVVSLPEPMSISAARVVCRRYAALETYTAYGDVTVTVNGYRFDKWTTTPTVDEDVIELLSESVITGVPGVSPWAGEQRSAPFRPALNTTVDAVSVTIDVAGPVEVEMVQLGESMDDLK